jgi:hypothetical protein
VNKARSESAATASRNNVRHKDGQPFGIGGLWENWKDPRSGEWIRTFAVITTDANEVVAQIHDRMPLILARWLSEEADPHDLLRPFPAEPIRIWPVSTRVNKPENDDPSVVEPIAALKNEARTLCYHFATQLGSTGCYGREQGRAFEQNPLDNSVLAGTEQNTK